MKRIRMDETARVAAPAAGRSGDDATSKRHARSWCAGVQRLDRLTGAVTWCVVGDVVCVAVTFVVDMVARGDDLLFSLMLYLTMAATLLAPLVSVGMLAQAAWLHRMTPQERVSRTVVRSRWGWSRERRWQDRATVWEALAQRSRSTYTSRGTAGAR